MSPTDAPSARIEPAPDPGAAPDPAVDIDLDDAALDALIGRVEHARDHHLALAPQDLSQLLAALAMLAHVHERLEASDLTIGKLRRLLGIARSSERTRNLAAALGGDAAAGAADGAAAGADGPTGGDGAGRAQGDAKGRRRGSGKPRAKPPAPEVHKHPITALERSACCPECGRGRLYKFAPAEFTRVRGNPMYTTERHVMEQLRCNACQSVHTAPLPAQVLADGARGQMYGYTAVALMGIVKYFGGEPFFRSMTIQGLLGVSLSPQTLFDQCERLSTALNPVYRALQRAAATATLIHIDDTTHRIVEAQPVRKRSRDGRMRLRSGVYTSALLGWVHDPPDDGGDGGGGDRSGGDAAASEPMPDRAVVLFDTGIGHAGEWLDRILAHRPAQLAAPVVMADALASNRSVGHEVVRASCNAHARRGFFDVAASYPDQALYALELYQRIWIAEAHCRDEALDPEARLAWHQVHSGPAMEALHAWCIEQLGSGAVEANGTLGGAMRYLVNHFEALTRFLRAPGAPVDNNVVERLIKLVVRGRKNFSFYRSEVGAGVSDVITSVLATCHENQVNGFDYLVAVQRHAVAVRSDPERWLPWNYEVAMAEIEATTDDERAAAAA